MAFCQVVTQRPIEWRPHSSDPSTWIGAAESCPSHDNPPPCSAVNYSVSVDYFVPSNATAGPAGVEPSGVYVQLCGRAAGRGKSFGHTPNQPIQGFCLLCNRTSQQWALLSGGDGSGFILAKGPLADGLGEWHRLGLAFLGSTVEASMAGQVVASVENSTFARGMVVLGSGWHHAAFDNFSITSKTDDGVETQMGKNDVNAAPTDETFKTVFSRGMVGPQGVIQSFAIPALLRVPPSTSAVSSGDVHGTLIAIVEAR